MRATVLWLAVALVPLGAGAAPLPAELDPKPPFPHVILQAPSIEQIAPGVEYGDYELWCDDGPISVHVVAADLQNPAVHVGTVLADDALGPDAETVSSMAQRTGAIAGVNGDYFDIGRTNHPTNIVVRDGMLIRTPRERYALAILRDGGARLAEFSFSGSVRIGAQTLPLDAINTLPATPDAISLLTPTFGPVGAQPSLVLVTLQPNAGVPFGSYRVGSFVAGGVQPPGYYLALGAQAIDPDHLPDIGETIVTDGNLAPLPLADIANAVGGGPLVLQDGHWFDDPDGPSGGAFDHRIPSTGAALERDGTLLLIEVDGRQPERSVGLTRPELAALMLALGARDGMAFDGGGSSEMAVQLPGEPNSALVTSPSDGVERRVADGIFVYNVAPVGVATSVAADPETIRAVSGATVPLRLSTVDANDHVVAAPVQIEAHVEPASLGSIEDGLFVAQSPGRGVIDLHGGTLSGSIRVSVDAAPARLAILPPNLNVDPGETTTLQARAFDARGYELTLPRQLDWSASSGTIDDTGTFTAADRNADVRLDVGGRVAATTVTVGSHEQSVAIAHVEFLTFPRGGPGEAASDPSCPGCVHLRYSIGPQEDVAYAVVEQPLPNDTVGMSFDLLDDGSGAELRIALRNAIDEQILVSATTLDQPGRRRVVVRFPRGILQPLRLVGFYTIGTKSTPQPKGEIVIGALRALVAGEESAP
jgi:hypothetical protein